MDVMGEYDDYSSEYEEVEGYDNVEYIDDDVPFREGITVSELYEECVKPTMLSATDQLSLVFIFCLVFKITTQLLSVRQPLCHILSFLCGVFGLFALIGSSAFYTCVLAISTYWAVLFCFKRTLKDHSYRFVMLSFLLYLVIREYFQVLPEQWEQIRGIHMIMIMKCLSVAYEGWQTKENPPPFLDYVGYIFCPATVIFGPWIPIKTYLKVYEPRRWTFGWVVKVFATTVCAFVCLGISSCWVYWPFLDIKSNWFLAARDALSVRFSHYFIAFVSEATCVLSGFYGADEPLINIEVTKPWKIEFPRSLVEVVVYWNQPMHRWLKIHIFRAAKRYGYMWRIIVTFLVSSLLHGLNFSLSMVLLSLGFYTYVEHNLRAKLASIFDACINSRQCPQGCKHTFKSTNVAVVLLNLTFSILAYFHLAYLGVMMDKKNDTNVFTTGISQQLTSWSNLGYMSHWVVLITYLFSTVI